MRSLVVGLLSIGCFLGAYLVLTNQTPVCYTEHTRANGTVERHQFSGDKYVTEHSNPDGSSTSQISVPGFATGCSSDALLPWEAITAALLLVAGLVGPLVLLRPKNLSVGAGIVAKTMLGVITLLALFDLIGAGAFVAPLLIPLLWLAARHAGRWMKGVWIFLASVCGWATGLLVVYGVGTNGMAEYVVPFMTAAAVAISFVATTTESGRPSEVAG